MLLHQLYRYDGDIKREYFIFDRKTPHNQRDFQEIGNNAM